MSEPGGTGRRSLGLRIASPALRRDPICGMMVPADAPLRATHEGQDYRFCNPRCLTRFQADPAAGLRADAQRQRGGAPGPAAAAAYVCPMDPEVRAPRPGACPKCGMALEPELPAPPRVLFACPMHPAIVRDAPGACPKCGMPLEPRAASTADDQSPELASMRRRLQLGVALTPR
jgi:Cu+-exporting ATPase